MKKLTKEEFDSPAFNGTNSFNKYHGSNFTGWYDYEEKVGHYEDYEIYSAWFDIRNTPLYRALQEKEDV